jgi:hypothetical protein
MRLGLIADIHERIEFLRPALNRFCQEQVDRVVVLGDVFETGERIGETCCLLAEAQAVGVWGNHDFGLCDNPSDKIRAKYPAAVVEYMTTLRPRLELAGCYFAHVEPWLDPEDIQDLWFFEGPPESDGRLKQVFDAVPNRLMFAGHYHRWLPGLKDSFAEIFADGIRLDVPRVAADAKAARPGEYFTAAATCQSPPRTTSRR